MGHPIAWLPIGRRTTYGVAMAGAMREPTYFVLASLLDGPLHGYAIVKQTAELSGGRVRLSTGTLYGALDRLADEGLILPGPDEVVNGRVRRVYTLTAGGHDAVQAEAVRFARAADVVRQRLDRASARRLGLA
jgi:PadR family transcriptional regulator, regulatory protein PadR